MVRNESDIIEAFVRHNLTLLDELHIIDHDSSDNTKEILQKLKDEGLPIRLYHFDELEFIPVIILTNVLEGILETDSSVDYIFPLDADEFIYCPSRHQLDYFLSLIPENRVGMYTWRGYLPNSTDYDPDFLVSFKDQREERIFTPKVIIPRKVAEQNKLTIGNHLMIDQDGNDVKSMVFRASNYSYFDHWFEEKFDAQFIDTDDLWLGHYPIRTANQQIKKTLEKSITMAIKHGGGEDVAWENQLRDLLSQNMILSTDELRLIAFQYRSTGDSVKIFEHKPLRVQKLELKYLDLVDDSPLPTVARLILKLADKLRK